MMNRREKLRVKQQRSRINKLAERADAVSIFNILTSPELFEVVESHLPVHRERQFPPTVTLAMFINQVLGEDGSLQQAVNQWAVQMATEGLTGVSTNTGAYCRARQRLDLSLIKTLCQETGRLLHEAAEPEWCWRGRNVKLVDGTGLSMPDTVANQARYPQPSSQAEGVGFPHIRMVGVTCLATGGLLSAGLGSHAGKGQGELGLIRALDDVFEAGDVVLADALYCSYFLVAELQAKGVDIVCEQHGSRRTDFRRGQSLGVRDHRIEWKKPTTRPSWMTPEQYTAVPPVLGLREVEVGGRILVTTLVEPGEVHKNELNSLYKQRWQVELDIRNIKTTMKMDVLRCKAPDAVEKEIWVHLLAYNLIRLLMAQAASNAGLVPREISFKHTVQLWTQWQSRCFGNPYGADISILFILIAQRTVGKRPGRQEPRACKRRPKSSKWLKEPRAQARQRLCETGEVL